MEAEKNDGNFVPQVPVGLIPKVKQEFLSAEEAYSFYNQYAKEAGFSVRIANCKKKKETNEYVWKLFACSKEGKTNETYRNKLKNAVARSGERNRGHTRCGCQARLTVVKPQVRDVWVVSYFVEQHNHPFTTPSKVHLLRSHRSVSATKKALAPQFAVTNLPTCEEVQMIKIETGSLSSVGCLDGDNQKHEKDVKIELLRHDSKTLIEHFKMEKEKNENFYYVYEMDNDGSLVRCFWADSKSRSSYRYFGEAMVFDTTSNTNKYGMVFAPFVGVNNHRQTTVFGCGLLTEKKTESFVWLFSRFLEGMPHQVAPRLIITDQDTAISEAVAEVFPDALHRYCLWHILHKFYRKLNVALCREKYHKLVDIIKDSESAEEFEHRWSEVMNATELGGNEWLMNMYDIRHRWVPAYVNHVFAAGMSSSQRVGTNHSFFKKYLNEKNSLMDFITGFNRALIHQRDEELMADHVDVNEEPRVATWFIMELQMVRIYTKAVFLLFQKELKESCRYIYSLTSSSDASKEYVGKQFEMDKMFDGDPEMDKTSARQRELKYHVASDLISCSCRLFEFDGYPCRHMLCWMRVQQVMMLPDKYIVRRWTKNAKNVLVNNLSTDSAEG